MQTSTDVMTFFTHMSIGDWFYFSFQNVTTNMMETATFRLMTRPCHADDNITFLTYEDNPEPFTYDATNQNTNARIEPVDFFVRGNIFNIHYECLRLSV